MDTTMDTTLQLIYLPFSAHNCFLTLDGLNIANIVHLDSCSFEYVG